MAKGYHQEKGIDYTDTFSPVVKQQTIRVILCLAIQQGWSLKQLDVSNAFLYGNLTETVYMKQPPGFHDPAYAHYVCQLHKSLYGLKQVPRALYTLLSTFLTDKGFKCSTADTLLFILHSPEYTMILLVYVDDLVITESSSSAVDSLISEMSHTFAMKDLGRLTYFLGLEVTQSSAGLLLHHTKCEVDLLHKSGMTNSKPVTMPSVTKYKKESADVANSFSNPTFLRSLVGALQYLTVTRPDLQYSVNNLCQRMHSLTNGDYANLKRTLKYI